MLERDKEQNSNLSDGITTVQGDRPSEVDSIGFDTYTDALAVLLTHESTKPPLTVSIEGDWGSGKSSFMKQLQNKLEDSEKYTVQFNPWRYEDRESLWTVFMSEFISQVKNNPNQNVLDKIVGGLKLNFLRFQLGMSWLGAFQKILTVGLGLCIALTIAMLAIFNVPDWLGSNDPVKFFIGGSGIAVAAVSVVTILSIAKDRILNPIKLDLTEYVDGGDYDANRPLLSDLHNDFDRIVKSYVKDEPVFVFIDDLDRCTVPKSADLLQGLNLLLDSHPRVFLVLAIERDKVAAGLTAKHKEILPYLSEEGELTSSSQNVEFGHKFLEKFIQLPFRIPRPREDDLESLLFSVEENRPVNEDSILNTKVSPELEDALFTKESDIWENVSEMIGPFLNHNPRQIKKFGNSLRLQALLAHRESILSIQNNNNEHQVTIQQLAKYVAISIEYPRLAGRIGRRPETIDELQNFVLDEDNEKEPSPFIESWAYDEDIIRLFEYGSESDDRTDFQLDSNSIRKFLQISPPIEPTKDESETDSRTVRRSRRSKPNLSSLLGSRGRMAILEVFLSHPDTSFKMDEVAELAGVAQSTVSRHIGPLVEQNLVQKVANKPMEFELADGETVEKLKQMRDSFAPPHQLRVDEIADTDYEGLMHIASRIPSDDSIEQK
ncbi:P-loop NTPase fold protein [Haloferax prahovense]|uniref:P-loop NTPase fold protein n=1 Tax=Haloferax prahovense TaxID=381852 RepID=UPI003C74AAC4